jgi:hypothetical protein
MKEEEKDESHKDKEHKSDSYFPDITDDIIIDGLLGIPTKLGKSVMKKVNDSNITETLSSTTDVIGEHVGNIPEIATDVIKGVAEGVGNVVGDIFNNIDLS